MGDYGNLEGQMRRLLVASCGQTQSRVFKMSLMSLLGVFLVQGCGDSGVIVGREKECLEPRNPYNDGGGHDKGFQWAEAHGGPCGGNSTSFREGCEEYLRQLREYKECLAAKGR